MNPRNPRLLIPVQRPDRLFQFILALQRFPEAEQELLEAEPQLPPRSIMRRQCLEDLASLYDGWGNAGGGASVAAKGAHWKTKLATEFPAGSAKADGSAASVP